MQYSTRPQAEWNVAIPRVVINLISNTVKVQCYTHYTCIQNHVRALKTETMHSSKTMLSYQQGNATVTVATAYMRSRTTTTASEWRIGESDLPRVCEWMLLGSTRDWLASSLSNNKSEQYLDGTQTMTPRSEYFLRSVPTTKRHFARQTPPSAPPNIICCSCTSSL